jgi:BirA family biotin operon repressor/biotin-[acetyl-CoA-carboxylase] ligase
MDRQSVQTALADLDLPAVHFFASIGSTNDEAWRLTDAGASHGSLVVADEQTAGRGRYHHHWVTTRGSGLAFSLILLSPPFDPQFVHPLTGLGALAVCITLQNKYALPAQIKWPNDILINQRKAAGVLVDAHWIGEVLKTVIIGIGINIASESVNPVNLPPEGLNFPATCLEDALGHPVERLDLLHALLQEFFSWLPRLSSQDFIRKWEDSLAYLGQWVELSVINPVQPTLRGVAPPPVMAGKLIGLAPDGSLKLLSRDGRLVTAQVGEIHMKPAPAGDPSLPPD